MPTEPAPCPTVGTYARIRPSGPGRPHGIVIISGQPGGDTTASRVDCLRAGAFRRAQPSGDAKLSSTRQHTTEADG